MAGEGGGGGGRGVGVERGWGRALLASASMLFAIRRSLCFRVCCKTKSKNRKKKKKEQTICDRLCTALVTTRRQRSIKFTHKGLRQGAAGFSTVPLRSVLYLTVFGLVRKSSGTGQYRQTDTKYINSREGLLVVKHLK